MLRLVLCTALLCAAPVMAAPLPEAAPAISVVREEWVDTARERTLPIKIYVPRGDGPFPVVIHSHGLGGNREGSSVILTPLATDGFIVLTLQHPGSDTSILTPAARAEAAAGRLPIRGDAAVERYRDAQFAVRELTRRNVATGPLRGKLDLKRLGMSGHSFGALGTLVALGQTVPKAPPGMFREPALVAGIVYSPNKPRADSASVAFRGVKTPILHFTGTEDRSPMDLEETPWARTTPFQSITGADQFLVVVDGGDHMLFSGRRTAEGRPKPADAAHLQTIISETIRFWRAYLKSDTQAATELCALPQRAAAVGSGFVKAPRCGPPTPIRPVE
jgi:dienelactone hydrolase